MACILALDQGTTSSRAIVFDERGDIRGVGQVEFTQHFPQPGWVEHDALEIWRTQLAAMRQAVAAAGSAAADIAALGITNQRETVVVWERATGQPIAPAIVWQDRRTVAACAALRAAGHEEEIRRRTGLTLDPYFSALKIAWLLDHVPGARRRAENGELAFGTIDSWLVWQLTGGRRHVTDASNASRTMLYDLARGDWDDALLGLLRVPRAMLPQIVASSGVCAECDAAHLGRAIPIAGIAGDQQAATFGQACLAPGMVKNTYGTGCFMLMNTGAAPQASTHHLLTTVGWRIGGATSYLLEGSIFMAGATVQWLRDGLGIIGAAGEVEALAASVPDSGGVVLVPAFAGLGAPHWDAHARGLLIGLTRGSGRAHIARAALESIALQSADVLDAMVSDAGAPVAELRVDGGAANNDLLLQLQADIANIPVLRPRLTETTALGAAYLAGLAVGVWRDADVIGAQWRVERRFEPAMPDGQRAALRERWARAVERAKGWETA
ncbi:MAG: glycerol kinase GlpK [Rhodocyclaceae bacterium]|nr:glycerol kinase GlpK [Rhodocyclaceae bacterium]